MEQFESTNAGTEPLSSARRPDDADIE